MRRWRAVVLGAGVLAVLAVANREILHTEDTIESGRTLLLALRTANPITLVEDDHLNLLYAHNTFPKRWDAAGMPNVGHVILSLGEGDVGLYARPDDGAPLGAREIRVRYERSYDSGELRYGAAALPIPESDPARIKDARYAVHKLDSSGESVLIGLARADFSRIPIR